MANVNGPQLLEHFITIQASFFADEPTASLDTQRAYQVTEMLAAIAHEQGRGVIMITHDTRLLDKVDRIYVMNDGYLVEKSLT